MSSDNSKHIREAISNEINLELFSAVLDMAAHTSEQQSALSMRWQIERSLPWEIRGIQAESFFAPYGLRYVGEVLERFEEHFGATPRNFRAVALALGYASPFLAPSMFVGRQKEIFLRKLQANAGQDTYLLAARYLLSPDTTSRAELLTTLSTTEYSELDKALLVLSLYEDPGEGFTVMRPQLVRLLGSGHKEFQPQNIHLLDWFLSRYKDEVKACRKKDNAVLRALLKLPYQFAKPESPVRQTLLDAGYTELEICYANIWLIRHGSLRDRLNANGITAEKTAAEFCVVFLNSAFEPPEYLYEFLTEIFARYSEFEIRYQENEGIWEAIEDRLNPVSPKTVLWMIQNIKKSFTYHFDVFASEWDILAHELSAEKYWKLFTEQMLAQESPTPEGVQTWLKRYQELTGMDYLSWFGERQWDAQEAFSFLVKTCIIDLCDFFSTHCSTGNSEKRESEISCELYHIREYALSAKSREAFDFLKCLFDNFSVAGLPDIFGQGTKLHSRYISDSLGYSYSYRKDNKLTLKRDFLSAEEQRQLYEWIDESVFLVEPKNYFEFVQLALQDQFVQELFDRERLSNALKAMIAAEAIKSYDANPLKEKFFTQEELEAERAAKVAAKEKAEREARLAALEKKREQLLAAFDGTMGSLLAQIKKCSRDEDLADTLPLIQPWLTTAGAAASAMELKEVKDFFALCKKSYESEAIPKTELSTLMGSALSDIVANTAYPLEPEFASFLFMLCGELISLDAMPREALYPLVETMIRRENSVCCTQPNGSRCCAA